MLAGEATCTRKQVVDVCRRHGVDPVKKGWVAPPPGRHVERFTPTPELVHGVEVGHPGLALVLRRLGCFSGKAPPVPQGTAQVQAVELARGMAAGLAGSGARGAACEAVALAPIKVSCEFQNANGTTERVGATVTMVSPSRARVTLKSSTAASYCIDSTPGSSKRKQAVASSAVASSACP